MKINYSARAAVILIALLILGTGVAQNGPDSVIRGTKEFRKNVLISGLDGPWELTWGPDDMLWVTERTGKRISRIDPASGKRTIAIKIAEVSAPGAQDGLLGMALHPDLQLNNGNNYVYAAYSYVDTKKGANQFFPDPGSPYHSLYTKIVRLSYDKADGTLSNPVDLITGLPIGNDHVSGRLKIGPDRKLYFTVGDEGHNQQGNFCLPIESQRLPTRDEIDHKIYAAYVGKSLRLNLDGSIPADNPRLGGVVSHVYTYGHRNMQGIDFGPDGTLYASEQGPKTDDEINLLKAGANYGWPYVVGMKGNTGYEYARWADSSTPCSQLSFSFTDSAVPPSVPRDSASMAKGSFQEPIATMFTVSRGFNFENPVCKGIDFLCWPTVAASSVEYYASQGKGIPGWDKVLLVTTLKRGSLYVLPLSADGKKAGGNFSRYFQSENRYRDTAVSPDGRTIYIATDREGIVEALHGGLAEKMENPGAILAFTYVGEGSGAQSSVSWNAASQKVSDAPLSATAVSTKGLPQFSAEQAAAGKTAFDATCAACHGNTMTNGTFGPPLAGEYFRKKWAGQTVQALHERAKTMPPSAPGSLQEDTYRDIVAYVLQVNGFKAGSTKLAVGPDAMGKMTIR